MTNDNVVALRDAPIPGKPVEILVECLEDLLARAQAGEIIGFAYAVTEPAGATATGWRGADGTRHPLCSAIAVLQHRYTEALARGV